MLATLVASSCQVDRIDVPADELYTREFIKEFGICDPKQDWNAATPVTAKVDASTIPGTSTIYIYDRMPGAEGCQLAAEFSAKTADFTFDFGKHLTRAYVQAFDADGRMLLSSYLPISNSTMLISRTRSLSRASETPDITLIDFKAYDSGNTYFHSIGSFNHTLNDYWSQHREFMEGSEPEWQKYLYVFNIYGMSRNGNDYINNFYRGTYTTVDDSRTTADLAAIVGSAGVFHEHVGQNASGNNECNLHKYHDLLAPEDGVIYDAPNGEVTLEYMYGAAAFHNSFGYFYYREDATTEDILAAPKFILMLDATPWGNTQRLDNGNVDSNWQPIAAWTVDKMLNENGTLPSDDIADYEKNHSSNISYKPSFYKLVYYPIKSDGSYDLSSPTYKFEKGIKIAFFSLTHGFHKITRNKQYPNDENSGVDIHYPSYITNEEIRFSIPWMNKLFGQRYDAQAEHGNCSLGNDAPLMSFVKYKWNGASVMGLEDGTYEKNDHDMNDILFMVHGVEDNSHNFETYPIAQSWIIACEDLGSTYDFDFNDMVFGVSYIATDKNNRKVYIKALAAGGTMPLELFRNDVKIRGEKEHWNHWFGDDHDASLVLNAESILHEGDEIEITLGENEEFSLSSNMFQNDASGTLPMGGFKVRVNGNTWVRPVGTTGDHDIAPQMMLLPASWQWPKERVPVYVAYPGSENNSGVNIPGFSEWFHSNDYTVWNSMIPAAGKVVTHSWKGHQIEK